MNCKEWQDWIQRNLDGDLSPAEGEELNRHLSTCPVCAQVARELEKVSRLLSGLPRPEPPVSLVDQVLNDNTTMPPAEPVVNSPRSHRKKWLFRTIPAGVAVAAVILAMVSLKDGFPIGGKSRPDLEGFEMEEADLPPGNFQGEQIRRGLSHVRGGRVVSGRGVSGHDFGEPCDRPESKR